MFVSISWIWMNVETEHRNTHGKLVSRKKKTETSHMFPQKVGLLMSKVHSAEAALAISLPPRRPISGKFLEDSPSHGEVSLEGMAIPGGPGFPHFPRWHGNIWYGTRTSY
jgi:hypothetical protein